MQVLSTLTLFVGIGCGISGDTATFLLKGDGIFGKELPVER